MDYKELRQTIIGYSSRNLEQRKNWYSPAAEAYDQVISSTDEQLN